MIDLLLDEIATPQVVGIPPSTGVAAALELMRLHRISCLVALENDVPVGILTERNILWAAAHRGPTFRDLLVDELMSSPVTTVTGDMRVYEAYILLNRKRIRHLVVVDETGKARGVITQSNIVSFLERDFAAEIKRVCQIMNPEAVTVPRNMTVKQALDLMAERSISCLVVDEDDRPVGIFTERDLARLFSEPFDPEGMTVEQVMSRPVKTIVGDAPAFQASIDMKEKGLRRLVVVDEDGKVMGLVTQTDVVRGLESRYVKVLKQYLLEKDTRLETVERTLLEKTLYLDTVLRFAWDTGIVATDEGLRVIYYNPAAERVFGYPCERVLGRDLREVHVQARVALSRLNKVLEAMEPGYEHTFDLRHVAGPRARQMRAVVTGIWDTQRRCLGYVLMVRDLTEHKRAEQELDLLNQQLQGMVAERTRNLAQQTERLKVANRRLTEMDRLKSDFLSVVTHELRTPLTSILGFAKLINKSFGRGFKPLATSDPKLERLAERIVDNLGIIEHEGERLTRMINDFLDLSRIESGCMAWRDEILDPAPLVREAAHAAESLFTQGGPLRLEVDLEPVLPRVLVDRDRLSQVLANLLNNAVKFTERGTVTVRASDCQGLLRLEVSDTGSGIPAHELGKVFDKFHQAYRRVQEEKPQGTGLGLAICRQIVEHYHGRIWAESEEGRGSSFIVELPAVDR